MVQSRTVSILNALAPGTDPLGPFSALWRATSQIVTDKHWMLQVNSIGLKAWLQVGMFLEWATDTIPDGISVDAQECPVRIDYLPAAPGGTNLWQVEPVVGAGAATGNQNPVTRAQVESGQVDFAFTYDGGLNPPYPPNPITGELGLAKITESLATPSGTILWSASQYITTLLNDCAVEMVGYSPKGIVSFLSGYAECSFSGANLTAVIGSDPQIGTYPGPPPATEWWANETGEASNISQYIASWTSGEIKTAYTIGTPPADAPPPSDTDTVITISVVQDG